MRSADDKKEMCKGPGYILVDDLKKNIKGWREAGGTGIWFLKDNMKFTEQEIMNSGI